MTSPDLTPYVDLTLFDRDAEEVFETFLTDVRSKLPDYDPQETNTEIVIAESLALEVAEEIFAINRLPSATIEGVLRLFGVERSLGVAPVATLEFRLGDLAGHTIPAGTRAALLLPDGQEPIVFTTDTELTVAEGSNTGTVAATGDRLTADANGYAAGTLLELLDAIVYAEGVTLASAPSDGADAEADASWLARGVARFARLSDALSMPKHFELFATEFGIDRAKTVDLFDPTVVGGAPGNHPGHVTVAVYGADDQPVSETRKAELLAELIAVSAPHLVLHVVDPTVTSVNVTATVVRESAYDAETVIANCEAAVRDFLSAANWPWTRLVRRTQIIGALTEAEGVAFVANLSDPSTDLRLPGVVSLTRPGVINVLVVTEDS